MNEQQQFWMMCALLREQVYQNWNLVVKTEPAAWSPMQDILPGQIVCEMSLRLGDPRNSIGLLLESGEQPRSDWDEAVDGPNPGEPYWLIRTLDGRDFRWTNAMFIVVSEPTVHPRYEVRSIYDQLRSLWAQQAEDTLTPSGGENQ